MVNFENKIKFWWSQERSRLFIISGFAGCGKTYNAKLIPEILGLHNVAFLAPTGKASLILNEGAKTIHSYMYKVEENLDGTLKFTKKQNHEFNEQLLIVDEISMVNYELLKDLRTLHIPMIGLGDPAQLPPVQGSNDILHRPDIFLDKVWRNDGGILKLSTDIRTKNLTDVKDDYENVYKIDSVRKRLDLIDDDTTLICKTNATRKRLNTIIRFKIKKFYEVLEVGDKLICLKNDRELMLMNGSIVTVKEIISIDDKSARIVVTEPIRQEITVDLSNLMGGESKGYSGMLVDYAYAITCHKAQGSEYKRVVIINELQYMDKHNNWLYTAVTRAREEVYITEHI